VQLPERLGTPVRTGSSGPWMQVRPDAARAFGLDALNAALDAITARCSTARPRRTGGPSSSATPDGSEREALLI
jgi:hypothetical protein